MQNGRNLKIYLAPMEGVVDWIMRERLSEIGGYDQMTTEFVRITSQLLPPKVYYRYCPELKQKGRTKAGTPVYVQLLGSDAQVMAENAGQAVELGALGIDLNFGCPAKTVNRNDGGAAILKDPSRLYPIISTIRRALPPHIPLTAKVRLGFDHKESTAEIAQATKEAGASRLTIHARTKVDGYKPPAHWHYIKDMLESCKKINSGFDFEVVANGDIWNVEEFEKCRTITGCTSFALGRPAIANPFLGRQIKNLEINTTSWSEFKNQCLREFLNVSAQTKSEEFALARGKQWLRLLKPTYPEAGETFEQIKRSQNLAEVFSRL